MLSSQSAILLQTLLLVGGFSKYVVYT